MFKNIFNRRNLPLFILFGAGIVLLIGVKVFSATQIPDCNWNCNADDVSVVNDIFYLSSDADGNNTSFSCTPGQLVTAYIQTELYNNASQSRYAIIVTADVFRDGTNPQNEKINNCALDSIDGKQTTKINLGSFNWICGQEIELRNAVVSWETGNPNTNCFNAGQACSERGTKCYGPKAFSIAAPLVADFDFTDVCYCNDTQFTDATTGGVGPYTYSWDFDGDLVEDSTDQNPVFHYSQAGTYTVTLSVTDNALNTDSQSYDVTVYTGPIADFTANPLSGYVPLSVDFSDSSTAGDGAIVSWSWDFDNDSTEDSTDQNPSYEYTSSGSYTVSLAVTDEYDCSDTETKVDYILVSDPSCGNGIQEQAEECDDGQNNGVPCNPPYDGNCQYCSNTCSIETIMGPYCGDGTKNGPEECDGQDGVGAHQDCSRTCTLIGLTYCGDGTKQTPNDEGTGGPQDDGYEECDGTDGVPSSYSCTQNCILQYVPNCGNWIVDPGEQCDGHQPRPCTTQEGYSGLQSCLNCLWTGCVSAEYCGDGTKNGPEECDGQDGVGAHQDCSRTCTLIGLTYCGDGTKQTPNDEGTGGPQDDGYEECDGTDGVGQNQACSQTCELIDLAYCGDGKLDPGEGCDDGNNISGDGCTSYCVIEGSAAASVSGVSPRPPTSPIPPAPEVAGEVIEPEVAGEVIERVPDIPLSASLDSLLTAFFSKTILGQFIAAFILSVILYPFFRKKEAE